MKPGTILLIIHDAIGDALASGIITTAGDFVKPTVASAVALAVAINTSIIKNGVTEPVQVQQILTLIASIAPVL